MLNKQDIAINFAQGLNTKSDPWQLPPGQFLALENSVFTKAGLLQKRNGFGSITAAPSVASYLTTLNDNLVTVSSAVNAYNSGTETWVSKGYYQPVSLSVLPVVRNSSSQTQGDVAVAPNGLACLTYTENSTYKFVVYDSVTGQNIVSATSLPVVSGSVVAPGGRVWYLDGYFVVVYPNVISSTITLRFIAISAVNPVNPDGTVRHTAAQVTSAAVQNGFFEGAVAADRLFLAFPSATGGQSIKITYLTQANFAAGSAGHAPLSWSNAAYQASTITVCADQTNPLAPQIYVSFYSNSTTNGFTASCNYNLAQIFAPRQIISTVSDGQALVSAASNGSCRVVFEQFAEYPWSGGAQTDFLSTVPVSAAGSVGSTTITLRGVTLVSKAFPIGSNVYCLVAAISPFQPTYFLIDVTSTPTAQKVVAKLAYENGASPVTLSNASVLGNKATIAYLYKDLITPLNTLNNTQQSTTGGIYSQTGVNTVTFDFDGSVNTAEIADNLHLGGGFLWNYDGALPVEHNFFLWPEEMHASNQTGYTITGGVTNASAIVSVSIGDITNIGIGQKVAGTSIPAGATVTAILSPTTFQISASATATHPSETITFTGNQSVQQYYYQVVYEWTDQTGKVYRSAPSIPLAVTGLASSFTQLQIATLRQTYKSAVRILIYRWSTTNQVYYQITSPTSPLLNDTTVDYVTYVDSASDASIIGNSIIYTAGGTVEDINAPASSILSLFDTRLWLVDAEDPNLLWFSKQVIEATPVEMSDLFTFYVAPTSGSQGSTGPMTALSPMDDKLIIFKPNAIYYINGAGPDNTGTSNQYSQPIFVTSTVGCANPQSIVFMPNGLMFQSDKGIWLLDRGMNTTYIGAPVEALTTGATISSALNIPETNQVRFTLSTGITLMYDYFYSQWGTFVGVPAVSSCIYQGLHTYLNASGTVFQETPGLYTDNGEPTLLSFTTGWLNLASLQGFERAYYFYLLAQYYSPHKLNVGVSYNYVPGPAHTSLITPSNFSSATPSPYGDQPAPFGSPTAVEQWRVFFKQQKCQAFQISVQEIFDPSLGAVPGAGFTMSGISMRVAAKRGVRPIAARKSVG